MRDYEIDSDLRSIIIQKKLKFKQHDNGSTIKVNLYENGEKVNIDLAWTIVAKFKRADRNEYNRDVTSISDNSFITTLDSTVTAIVGDLEIDFKITYGDKQVTTFTVLLEIEESIGEGNSGDIGGNTGGNTEINVDLSTLKLSLDGTDLVLKNGTTDLSRVTLPTIAGKNVELQSNGTYIQYRYEGDTDWNNLVALSSLKGADGDTGLSAYELAQQETGFAGTIEQWLNSLVGATPNLQIGTVETLESGSSATASITGTTENPLLNLGIPKGADGSGTGTGGSSEKEWEDIIDITFTETVQAAIISEDINGNTFSLKKFEVLVIAQPSDQTSTMRINFNPGKTRINPIDLALTPSSTETMRVGYALFENANNTFMPKIYKSQNGTNVYYALALSTSSDLLQYTDGDIARWEYPCTAIWIGSHYQAVLTAGTRVIVKGVRV